MTPLACDSGGQWAQHEVMAHRPKRQSQLDVHEDDRSAGAPRRSSRHPHVVDHVDLGTWGGAPTSNLISFWYQS